MNAVNLNATIQYKSSPTPEDVNVLVKGIAAYDIENGIRLRQEFLFYIKDEASSDILGGCYGFVYHNNANVDKLWVDKSLRHKSYGTQLMKSAEALARDKECSFITVNTMSWQAVDFYKKLGYEVEFERHGFVNNSVLYMLRKALKKRA